MSAMFQPHDASQNCARTYGLRHPYVRMQQVRSRIYVDRGHGPNEVGCDRLVERRTWLRDLL